MSWGGGPHAPSVFLAGIGKGRFLRGGRAATLERYDGAVWCEVGRFGSVREADRALDEAVANGGAPDTFRVVEIYAASNRVLAVAGAVVLGVAIAIVLYVILG